MVPGPCRSAMPGTTGTFGAGAITDNANLTFDRTDNGLTISNAIGDSAINQIGSGTITLSGTNTWSGATWISAGTLKDGVASALPVGTALTVSGTGVFDLNGFSQTVASLADGGVRVPAPSPIAARPLSLLSMMPPPIASLVTSAVRWP